MRTHANTHEILFYSLTNVSGENEQCSKSLLSFNRRGKIHALRFSRRR